MRCNWPRPLPAGAQVSLVSHSRGGLVADLLCLGDFDALIGDYAYAFEGTGDADPAEAARVLAELAGAHEEQRAQLRSLARLLREKRLQIQRYVRCASPAQGTRLASGNFDLFLSGILTLIGQVPYFFGNPLYSAFKRVVIEIARNRTNPHLVPGIEAMLPDAPMARLLRDAPVRAAAADGGDRRRHRGRQPAETPSMSPAIAICSGRASGAWRGPAVRQHRLDAGHEMGVGAGTAFSMTTRLKAEYSGLPKKWAWPSIRMPDERSKLPLASRVPCAGLAQRT